MIADRYKDKGRPSIRQTNTDKSTDSGHEMKIEGIKSYNEFMKSIKILGESGTKIKRNAKKIYPKSFGPMLSA